MAVGLTLPTWPLDLCKPKKKTGKIIVLNFCMTLPGEQLFLKFSNSLPSTNNNVPMFDVNIH